MSGSIQTTKLPSLKRYFIGFSTQNSTRTGIRTIYDIELITADLAAAFNTRVGERVMRPDYGCKLWDYLMEPMTPYLREQVIDEATRICSLDSRLELQNVQVFSNDIGFRIEISLMYLPWRVFGTFTANFENADTVYFGTPQ